MAIVQQDFDQLMNQARVTLVGASDAGLKGAFYDVLSEFFKDSSCWDECITLPVITTSKCYPLTPSEGQIIRLGGVGASQCRFIPALMPVIGELHLQHFPNQPDTYFVNVIKNVALPTDRHMMPQAPDWVLPLWHVGILDGLLGKMMSMPGKSFTNAQGSYHLKRFRNIISEARILKLKANTNGASAWRFPQQFRSTSQQGGVPAIGSASERLF